MSVHPDLQIYRLTCHDKDWSDCSNIRARVFIEEQHVPVQLEWDADDMIAMHILGCIKAESVACARVLPDGQIGRMAVLPSWRGQGIGAAILHEAIHICRALCLTQVTLSAQVHAIGFYERAGFIVMSAPYLDANIPHVDMMLKLI